MTPADLKHHVSSGSDSHFFDRSSMKFFGDTMRNYGVRAAVVVTSYNEKGDYVGNDGVSVEVWELYRKHAVKHGLKSSAYFDRVTFKRVYPSKD